jgi:hypothetical protein
MQRLCEIGGINAETHPTGTWATGMLIVTEDSQRRRRGRLPGQRSRCAGSRPPSIVESGGGRCAWSREPRYAWQLRQLR